jgi:hypothetical protein
MNEEREREREREKMRKVLAMNRPAAPLPLIRWIRHLKNKKNET